MSQADPEPPSYQIEIAPSTDGGGDRIPDLSPREAVERYLDSIRLSKAEQSVSAYHYQLKLFVEWCEQESITSLSELNGWVIESYETYRRGQDLAAPTLNKEMLTLGRFLKYCARIELVDESLPEKVDPPAIPRDQRADDTMLHPDDAQALLEYYQNVSEERYSRAHALLTLAWYTGARLGALRGVDLEDYHSDERYIEFVHRPEQDTPLKNGYEGERAVGLTEEACEVLDGYLARNRFEKFDDHGRRPLITSQVGRASQNAVRAWMYLATVPCLHSGCPHGNERKTCDYVDYSQASKCPSSRSPHQVRTGSITWHRNRGWPAEELSKKVNSSVRVIEEHYDKPSQIESLEERRRQFVETLDFDSEPGGDSE
jgi:site-specific recombinase XerD